MMDHSENHVTDHSNIPPLSKDPSFYGMTVTQFLGSFNDNLFKQIVLLICVDQVARTGKDYQPIALALFAIPFVLFSGYAGYLSDRYSKRFIVVLAKIAEIIVMAGGLFAFLHGEIWGLFVVLGMMSTQSAFFGPPKYGILPELFRPRDLPQANGAVQMMTFVSIIFGMVMAGYVKLWFGGKNGEMGDIWISSLFCIGIAVVGCMTSLFVRKTPIAHPGLPFSKWSLIGNKETWLYLGKDRLTLIVLIISSLFWFIGGAVQPAINYFGKEQLKIGDAQTSWLAASMGIGIAFGCLLAGTLSKHKISFRMVRSGAWGICLSLTCISLLGASSLSVQAIQWLSMFCLILLGFSAGFFAVPLQVVLQTRPPDDLKGRMIGTMNLVNWIAIVGSSFFYGSYLSMTGNSHGPDEVIESPVPVSWIFMILAGLMLPIALFFHPKDKDLG